MDMNPSPSPNRAPTGQGRPVWPEALVALFVVAFAGAAYAADAHSRAAPPDTGPVQFQLKAGVLTGGALLARPGDVVDLVLAGQDGTGHHGPFRNLRVLGVYAADGHSVASTGEAPDGILFSAPRADAGAVLAALQDKTSAYLLARAARGAPTPPAPVAAPREDVAFALPAGKLLSAVTALRGGGRATVVLLGTPKDKPSGPTREIGRYPSALVLDIADVDGLLLVPPYRKAASVRVGVPHDKADEFARLLADATSIYLLPP